MIDILYDLTTDIAPSRLPQTDGVYPEDATSS
jgi:hypothetical protein